MVASLSTMSAAPVTVTAAPGMDLDWRGGLAGNREAPPSPAVQPARSAQKASSEPAGRSPLDRLPAPGVSEVGLADVARKADGSPVSLTAGSAAAAGRQLSVSVLDQAVAARAGVAGFVFRLSGPDGTAIGKAPLPVTVSVDYSGFAERFGGGYADRLRLVALPVCALAEKPSPGCATGGDVLASRNERQSGRLVADIGDLATLGTTDVRLAVTSGAEGEEGSFKATPLELSGDWEVNPGSGAFSYSYKVPLPGAPAGPTPQVGLQYSSAAADGMVSGRNTQSGQTGLGWGDFANAFIERRYNSCLSDGQVYADLCWKSDNATISLQGRSGELVPVAGASPKQWRLRDDPRWRVEQLTGAVNGDDNGEHWKVTTPDGVQYFFGLGVNPDVGAVTNSAWTVPVFGDDAGEPCSGNTPLAWCSQAWRWNLDMVIDPHDNVQQFEYYKEIEHYSALNGWPGLEHTAYVRSGALQMIKYGKRRVAAETTPAAMVRFTTDYRCLTLNHTCVAPTAATAADFPDVPVDLMCLTATCTQHSPTFFTTLRYSEVATSVNDGPDDGPFVPVDEVRLQHSLPDPDPNRTGDRKLYLTSIQREGLSEPQPITLPATTFQPVPLDNRIDTAGGLSAMPHYRVGVITNEYGGQTHVTYGQPHPCPNPIPDPPNWDLNTRDCFPHWHSPEGGAAGFAVFHKYVVTRVEERDPLGGSPTVATAYRYGDQVAAGLPNGAWHHDRDEFVANSVQSWSEWRGYADVVVAEGDSRTQYRLLRGMNNDRLAGDLFPGPGSRVSRASSLDGTVANLPDENWLAGQILDQQSLRANGTVEAGVVNGYHAHRTVDVTTSPDPLDDAWFVAADDEVERRRNPADGSFARRRTQTVYNGLLGTVDRVVEYGWAGVNNDERCTVTTPVFNTDRWMLDLPAAMTRYANATCAGAEVTREEYAYDGGAVGTAPTRGDQTTTRKKITAAATWAATTTTYDRLGRLLVVTDPNGHTTKTSYAPEIRYPSTTTVTNHLGHATATTWLRSRQMPRLETDARGKKTSLGYDALGRAVSVHKATEQGSGAPASLQFGYDIDPEKARIPVVRTRQLQDTVGGSPRYVDTWIVHDSWLRARQTHKLSPAPGKVIVANTSYDNRALVAGTSQPQALTGSPGGGILPAPAGGWANDTITAYDELRRPTWEITRAGGTYRQSVVTEYTHDTTKITPDPPSGGVVRTIKDAYDRVARVEELDGGNWRPTSYGYDAADRLLTVKDPADNTITNSYDMAGRKTAMSDPDAGNWTYGYDAAGNQTRTTSATGVALHTIYDALNRQTERRKDSVTGALLASWSYDAAGEEGLLDKSTRVDPSGNWIVDITGYDDRARPGGRSWTVPASVTGLAGTYTVGYGYDAMDHPTRISYPAVVGLPAENVTATFNAVGLPETMIGAAEYVWGTSYDDRGRQTWLLSGSRTVPFSRVNEYDSDQRVGRMKAGAGNTTLQDIQFGYNVTFGNLVDRDTTLNGQTWRECYDHDDRQRMTRAFTTTGTCSAGAPGTGPNPYNHTYQYGADGNLTRRTEGTTTINYGYPAAGAQRPHAPTSVGGNTYAWNANGDLDSRTINGQGDTFTWTAERRLAQVDDSTFVYDTDGARLLRRTSAGATVYVEGHEITKPASGSATAVRTYTFNNKPVAVRTSTGVEYLATDNQGSVQLTVPTGATAPGKVRTYLPYGQPRLNAATTTDRGWIGQIEDRVTGLDYLNARYYDPDIGRFISPDPLFDSERPQTINPYAYGLNNPASFSDPSGLIPLECRTGELKCQHNGKGWTISERPARPAPSAQNVCAPGGSHYGRPPCRITPPNVTVISGTGGPSVTGEELDEIVAEANRIRNFDPERLANAETNGLCGEGKVSWGVTLGVGMCVTWDGEQFVILGMREMGSGTPYVGAGVGALVSNARSADDIRGNAWCVGAGGALGGAASGEVCLGYSDDWEDPTGIWTVAGSVGGGYGLDVHVTAVYTGEVAVWTPGGGFLDSLGRGWGSLMCFHRCGS
jgi:RHS repeat-associated protein